MIAVLLITLYGMHRLINFWAGNLSFAFQYMEMIENILIMNIFCERWKIGVLYIKMTDKLIG